MIGIAEIERAVVRLSPEELAAFRRWFAEFDAAAWDAQLERDAAVGKLDAIAGEALTDLREGRARHL